MNYLLIYLTIFLHNQHENCLMKLYIVVILYFKRFITCRLVSHLGFKEI